MGKLNLYDCIYSVFSKELYITKKNLLCFCYLIAVMYFAKKKDLNANIQWFVQLWYNYNTFMVSSFTYIYMEHGRLFRRIELNRFYNIWWRFLLIAHFTTNSRKYKKYSIPTSILYGKTYIFSLIFDVIFFWNHQTAEHTRIDMRDFFLVSHRPFTYIST